MRRGVGFFVLFLLVSFALNGQVIRVGLYNSQIVQSLVFYCTEGEYKITYQGGEVGKLTKGDILFAVLQQGAVRLHTTERVYGSFETVEFKALSRDATFRIRPIKPKLDSRSYDDDLILRGHDRFITIINEVDFDKYIAGVLEAEVGPNAEPELYKAHALLTRTYMFNNFEKHREEGFSLCDDVHCQAYHGRAVYNPEIARAVYATTGEVVADFHYKLITAVYHSNSGGETQRAADVWLQDVDYLQAVIDPHSLHQPNAKWYDTIFYDDWKNYLLEKGMASAAKVPEELLYVQQRHRKKYFVLDRDSILMTQIREDWNLRSTFFNMFPEVGDRMVIWGKGYGHGVGLSQEGAMQMSRLGFSYKDIIRFYFFNVRLMDYQDLPASSIPVLDYDQWER